MSASPIGTASCAPRQVPLAEIAAAVGTPAYVYAGGVMRDAAAAVSSRPSPASGSWSATRSRRTATSP